MNQNLCNVELNCIPVTFGSATRVVTAPDCSGKPGPRGYEGEDLQRKAGLPLGENGKGGAHFEHQGNIRKFALHSAI